MIECVPNVSEGCDRATIEEIASAVDLVGAHLLDIHSDADHNRSVFTFVGERGMVADALLALCQVAKRRVDLTRHRGTHPRMGAVDVVPFVPLSGDSMTDCVELARNVGRRIADELEIPVYLYANAAARPDRRNLATIRRGGFECFGAKIQQPEWRPDFGPPRIHSTAGAVAVGARDFLVAYNIVLDTKDIHVARAIASAVRERDGGLAGVKALGMLLGSRDLTQVSMNLTDVDATTITDVFDAVRREADRRGVGIKESEIVGLVPRAALGGASAADILLEGDLSELILEDRIAGS